MVIGLQSPKKIKFIGPETEKIGKTLFLIGGKIKSYFPNSTLVRDWNDYHSFQSSLMHFSFYLSGKDVSIEKTLDTLKGFVKAYGVDIDFDELKERKETKKGFRKLHDLLNIVDADMIQKINDTKITSF